MYEAAEVSIADLPVTEWRESKFSLYDEHDGSVAYVLSCDGCGRQVTVSKQEYAKFDATLCSRCAAKAH